MIDRALKKEGISDEMLITAYLKMLIESVDKSLDTYLLTKNSKRISLLLESNLGDKVESEVRLIKLLMKHVEYAKINNDELHEFDEEFAERQRELDNMLEVKELFDSDKPNLLRKHKALTDKINALLSDLSYYSNVYGAVDSNSTVLLESYNYNSLKKKDWGEIVSMVQQLDLYVREYKKIFPKLYDNLSEKVYPPKYHPDIKQANWLLGLESIQKRATIKCDDRGRDDCPWFFDKSFEVAPLMGGPLTEVFNIFRQTKDPYAFGI